MERAKAEARALGSGNSWLTPDKVLLFGIVGWIIFGIVVVIFD